MKQRVTGFYEEIRRERRRSWQATRTSESDRERLRELTELDDGSVLEYLDWLPLE